MHFASEILFFSFLGLLLFGPTKMAEIARQVGAFVAQFKRFTADFESQITKELQLAEARKANQVRTVVREGGLTPIREGSLTPPQPVPEQR